MTTFVRLAMTGLLAGWRAWHKIKRHSAKAEMPSHEVAGAISNACKECHGSPGHPRLNELRSADHLQRQRQPSPNRPLQFYASGQFC